MKSLPILLRTMLGAALVAFAHADAPKTNIIFILTDDLGWGDIGVFYQNSRNFAVNRTAPAFVTPNIDRLAAEGLQLRRHYCPAPVCAPSRASLLLGVHQGHANVRDNEFDKALDDNHTLGTVLKQAGYATAMIGKYGLAGSGWPAPARPELRGFDYFFGYPDHGGAHFHYPKETGAHIYDDITEVTANLDKCYSTDFITARAKKWLVDQQAANPAQPFFLYLPFTAPHARLDVPTQAYPAGKGVTGGLQWLGTPGHMINTASGTINTWIHPDYANATYDDDHNPATPEVAWPDYAKRHATMIRRLDDAIADLMQTLKDLNIDGNTLVIFTSDNGPHNEAGTGGSYTQDPRFFESFGPLDGIKRDTWEGGMREPTIVRWPGHITAGSLTSVASQFHDWLPTFAELAGLPIPARTDGVSLVPTLTGTGVQRESTIYVEYQYSGSTPGYDVFEPPHRNAVRNEEQVVFVDSYKGVRYNVTAATDNFLIYDTLNDPKETTNLSGTSSYFTTLQQRMKDRVLQLRRVGGGSSRPYDGQLVPDIIPPSVVNGLDYNAYEKITPWVTDWTTETAVGSGAVVTPDLSVLTRGDNVGLLFSGYVRVPADGSYTFYLTTDTGAFVRLHDAQLIDADFGYTGGTEQSSGSILLKAGYHPLHIHYRHATAASHALTLQWSGPNIAKQAIPASALYHPGIALGVLPTANPDSASTTSNTPVNISVLANDSGGGTPLPLFISSVDSPSHGTATISGSQVVYTPANGFIGDDSFIYTVSDGQDMATAVVSVAVYPVTDGVWIPFDETSGTVAHDGLGRPIGTLNSFSGSPWIQGWLGNALAFDGVTDRVILDGYKGITGNAARTVAFWLNANATQTSGTRPTIVSWGASNSGSASATGTRFDINLNHSNGYKLRTEFNLSGVNFTTPSRSDLRGAGWVHCAIVVPAGATVSQLRGYIDGVLASAVFEPTTSGPVAINTGAVNNVAIGSISDSTSSRVFAGKLDDVRIYPRALTAAEIATLASQTPAANLPSQWYYRYSGNSLTNSNNWSAVPNADGLSARLEYALGGNLTVPSPRIIPQIVNGQQFVFNRRRDGIAASSYITEFSSNLKDWTPILDSPLVVPHPDLTGFDRVTVTLPSTTIPQTFYRLRVNP